MHIPKKMHLKLHPQLLAKILILLEFVAYTLK